MDDPTELITDHYESIIRGLDKPPILIGNGRALPTADEPLVGGK